jgi:hypothetical protein
VSRANRKPKRRAPASRELPAAAEKDAVARSATSAERARSDENPVATGFTPFTDFIAVQVSPPDAGSGEREQLCRQVDDYVWGSLQSLLFDPNCKSFNRQDDALDWLILDVAPSLGPLLFFSATVQNRLLQWHTQELRGAELFASLGKRLSRGANANQGKGKLPVEPWHYDLKKQVVLELAVLQRWLRLRTLKPQELRREIAKQVRRTDRPYPALLTYWTSFDKLMQLEGDTLADFSIGQTTPTQVAELWIAKTLGDRDPESTRQAISKAGRVLHASKLKL